MTLPPIAPHPRWGRRVPGFVPDDGIVYPVQCHTVVPSSCGVGSLVENGRQETVRKTGSPHLTVYVFP